MIFNYSTNAQQFNKLEFFPSTNIQQKVGFKSLLRILLRLNYLIFFSLSINSTFQHIFEEQNLFLW